jgi:hypothetical protein
MSRPLFRGRVPGYTLPPVAGSLGDILVANGTGSVAWAVQGEYTTTTMTGTDGVNAMGSGNLQLRFHRMTSTQNWVEGTFSSYAWTAAISTKLTFTPGSTFRRPTENIVAPGYVLIAGTYYLCYVTIGTSGNIVAELPTALAVGAAEMASVSFSYISTSVA